MILNANAGSHGMYLRSQRHRRADVRKPLEHAIVLVDGVRPDRNGSLAERCAWMKLRQRRRKRV
jgi:hypothetical protein